MGGKELEGLLTKKDETLLRFIHEMDVDSKARGGSTRDGDGKGEAPARGTRELGSLLCPPTPLSPLQATVVLCGGMISGRALQGARYCSGWFCG